MPLGYSQPGKYMSGLYSSGVSTSFEVGGLKTKVGGCEEARGQRPRGTRAVRGHAHPPLGKFLKLGVSVMHFPAFWPKNYDS